MAGHDERIDYFLMLTRLMSEADGQLAADADDRGSHPYAEDLDRLREAVQTAEEAAAKIVLTLITHKRSGLLTEREGTGPAARH